MNRHERLLDEIGDTQLEILKAKRDGTYPQECETHFQLNSRSRHYKHEWGEKCDNSTSDIGFKRGRNWYRISGPAGTRLAGSDEIQVSISAIFFP